MCDVETISFCFRPNCYPYRPTGCPVFFSLHVMFQLVIFQQLSAIQKHDFTGGWHWHVNCVFRWNRKVFSGGHRTEETIPTVFFDLSDYVGQLSDWQHVWVCWNVFSIGLWKHPGLVIKTDRSWPSIVTQIVSHEISAVCHVVCIIRSNTYFLSK
jgi:hypothetical protein